MLLAVPKEIIGKIRYVNKEPVAICDLTGQEQIIFDEFHNVFMQEQKNRFEDTDE